MNCPLRARLMPRSKWLRCRRTDANNEIVGSGFGEALARVLSQCRNESIAAVDNDRLPSPALPLYLMGSVANPEAIQMTSRLLSGVPPDATDSAPR